MTSLGRSAILGASAVVLALAGGAAAVLLTHQPAPGPSASQGRRLTLEMGRVDTRADASKPVRCFVDGRNVGEVTVQACATRNGVDARALDLGLDRSGVLSAGENDAALAPLPPVQAQDDTRRPLRLPAIPAVDDEERPGPERGAQARCLDYDEGGWRTLGSAMPLGVCIRRLFDGRCEGPGDARYGRWANHTVRLVPGRVEISADDHSFRPLAPQGPQCSLPPV